MSTEKNELIVPIDFDEKQAVSLFTSDNEFDALFKKIKDQTDAHEPDITTVKGRDEIKSLAYKVTRTKSTLDEMGKRMKAEAQKTVTAVDATRKKIRDQLDELKVSVRKPLTDYENAESEKDQVVNSDLNRLAELKNIPFNATSESIAQMQSEVQEISTRNDWRGKEEKAEALLDVCRSIHSQALSAAQDRERLEAENVRMQQERERMIQEQRQREAQEREQSAERERQEKARQDAEAAQSAEMERLKREKDEADQRAKDAETAAQYERDQAEQNRIAREREALERAKQAEQDRIEVERQAKLKAEQELAEREAVEKREAERKAKDIQEREARLDVALNDLMEVCDLTRDDAKNVIDSIDDGKIKHINFG